MEDQRNSERRMYGRREETLEDHKGWSDSDRRLNERRRKERRSYGVSDVHDVHGKKKLLLERREKERKLTEQRKDKRSKKEHGFY